MPGTPRDACLQYAHDPAEQVHVKKFALDFRKRWRKVLEVSCLVDKFAPLHHKMKFCGCNNSWTEISVVLVTSKSCKHKPGGGLRPFCACMEECAWKIVLLLAIVFYYQLFLCMLWLIINKPLIDLLRKSMFLTLTNYRALWRCCVSNLRPACV